MIILITDGKRDQKFDQIKEESSVEFSNALFASSNSTVHPLFYTLHSAQFMPTLYTLRALVQQHTVLIKTLLWSLMDKPLRQHETVT